MGSDTGGLAGALGALKAFRGVALAWFALSALAVLAGLGIGVARAAWVAGADRVQADVIAEHWVRRSGAGGNVRLAAAERPTFAWRDAMGRTHVAQHRVAFGVDAYRVGERVDLWINPDAPDDYLVVGFLATWLLPLALVAGGLLAAALAVPVLLFAQLFVMGARADARGR